MPFLAKAPSGLREDRRVTLGPSRTKQVGPDVTSKDFPLDSASERVTTVGYGPLVYIIALRMMRRRP